MKLIRLTGKTTGDTARCIDNTGESDFPDGMKVEGPSRRGGGSLGRRLSACPREVSPNRKSPQSSDVEAERPWREAAGLFVCRGLDKGSPVTTQPNDAFLYLEMYQRLRKWINKCLACQRQGCKSEMRKHVASIKLLRYFPPMAVIDVGLCDQCARQPPATGHRPA
jgi:hypothetical protein